MNSFCTNMLSKNPKHFQYNSTRNDTSGKILLNVFLTRWFRLTILFVPRNLVLATNNILHIIGNHVWNVQVAKFLHNIQFCSHAWFSFCKLPTAFSCLFATYPFPVECFLYRVVPLRRSAYSGEQRSHGRQQMLWHAWQELIFKGKREASNNPSGARLWWLIELSNENSRSFSGWSFSNKGKSFDTCSTRSSFVNHPSRFLPA